jgi:hypothetical protein
MLRIQMTVLAGPFKILFYIRQIFPKYCANVFEDGLSPSEYHISEASLTCVCLGLLESLILGCLIVNCKYEAELLVGEVVGLNVTQPFIFS